MLLTSLRIHPVKSLRGYEVATAEVEPWGLRDDRRWAVLAGDGEEVTAREHPQLLLVRARPEPDGALVLESDGRPPVHVPRPIAGRELVSNRIGPTRVASDGAAAWLSAVVGRDVLLVHQIDPAADRPVEARHGGAPGDVVNLADDGPLLLTSQSSLRRLDEWVAQTAADRGEDAPAPLSMVRFRPNLVIDGDEPFAEDGWRRIRVGEVEMRYAECCDRCVMTTYDPDSLVKGHEPIRTLARQHAWDGKVWFGVRLVPTTTGTIRIGDEVTVLP